MDQGLKLNGILILEDNDQADFLGFIDFDQ